MWVLEAHSFSISSSEQSKQVYSTTLPASLNLTIYHSCRICPRTGHHSIRNKYSETRWARLTRTTDVILNEQRETRTAFSRSYHGDMISNSWSICMLNCLCLLQFSNILCFAVDRFERSVLSIYTIMYTERGPAHGYIWGTQCSAGRIMIKEPN